MRAHYWYEGENTSGVERQQSIENGSWLPTETELGTIRVLKTIVRSRVRRVIAEMRQEFPDLIDQVRWAAYTQFEEADAHCSDTDMHKDPGEIIEGDTRDVFQALDFDPLYNDWPSLFREDTTL